MVVGRNPFAQSTMWVKATITRPCTLRRRTHMGALPVETDEGCGVPYWPVPDHVDLQRDWTHPVGSWIALMPDLAGPALVEGKADSASHFANSAWTIDSGDACAWTIFASCFPQGEYKIATQGVKKP